MNNCLNMIDNDQSGQWSVVTLYTAASSVFHFTLYKHM